MNILQEGEGLILQVLILIDILFDIFMRKMGRTLLVPFMCASHYIF